MLLNETSSLTHRCFSVRAAAEECCVLLCIRAAKTDRTVCLSSPVDGEDGEGEGEREREAGGRKKECSCRSLLRIPVARHDSRHRQPSWRVSLAIAAPLLLFSFHYPFHASGCATRFRFSLSPLLLSHSLSAFLSLPEYAMPGLRGRRTQSHTQRERQTYAITGGLIRSSRAQDEGARDARREAGIWSMSPSRGSPEEEAAAATGVSLSLSFLVSLSLSLFRRRVPATRGDDGCCCCLRRRRSCQRS